MVYTGEKAAEYARKWRALNRERAREIDAAKRAKKKEHDPAWAYQKTKEWREANPEKAREQALRQSARISEETRTDPEVKKERARKRAEYMARPEVRERRRRQFREWNKEQGQNDPTFHRRRSYRANYGITIEQYDAMLTTQGGKCAICGTDKNGKKHFHVDHNHTTGQVRALLCHGCNTGLGAFGDDPERLLQAVAYLEVHATS